METEPRRFHVFIASANDVKAERLAAKRVVERVRKSLEAELPVVVSSFLWEDDGTPCAVPAQEATNEDLDRAHIVVFIFGVRLGEGTMVEYRRALENRRRRRDLPEMMVYFSQAQPERDPVSLLALAAVVEFETAQHTVVRSASFETSEAFTERFRDDLDTTVRRLLKATPRDENRPQPADGGLPERDPYSACLEKRAGFLRVPGIGDSGARKAPLLDLYIELRLRTAGSRRSGKDAGFGMADRGDRGIEAVLAEPLVALVGEPGSGKSRALERIALRLARHHLGRDPDAPVELGLPVGAGAAPIPVWLSLPRLVDQLRGLAKVPASRGDISPDTWAELLEMHLKDEGALVVPGDGARLLQAGGVLFLFDSLDEVSGAATRETLAAAITTLSQRRGTGTLGPNRFVVACRTRAWGAGTAFAEFTPAEIEPLSAAAVQQFAVRWGAALYGDTPAAREHAQRLGEALAGPLRSIASNPQMLRMLAVIHHAGGRLPEQRSKLYDECVGHLVDSRRDTLAAWQGSPGARRHLRLLAERMQNARDGEGMPRHAIGRDEAVALLMPALDSDDAQDVREYLHELEVCTGLLSDDGRGGLAFYHRTFQEFLVAELARDAEGGAFAFLAQDDRFLDPGWLEVVTLTAGVLAEGGGNGVRKLLADIVGPAQDDLAAWAPRVAVAARCLSDLEPWRFDAHVVAPAADALRAVLPILEQASLAAPLETRVAVAEGLGRVHDPRLAPEKRWVTIPEGPAWRGASPGDTQASDDEKPGHEVWLSEFGIARWPVTVAEYAEFLGERGYVEDTLWLPEGLAFRDRGKIAAPHDWETQAGGPGNRPVTGVSWWEAQAYCAWLSAQGVVVPDGWQVHLPTEAQWERAARGPLVAGVRPAIWPWGDAPGLARMNCVETPDLRPHRLLPVGCFPDAIGPTGIWDQAGNVWEWCADWFDQRGWQDAAQETLRDPVARDREGIPTYMVPGLDDEGTPIPKDDDWVWETGHGRVVRGGGWADDASNARVSVRYRFAPAARFFDMGFRCAASPVALGLGPRP